MAVYPSAGQELVKGAGRFVGHGVAIVAGLFLMFAGIAMGVTIVMLPIGIPVGFVGLFAFLWGIFARPQKPVMPTEPPGRW
jgi:hypothetical protein